ncbi:MAG TPA: Tat pathway signal protein, partial [Chromatiales bacterium]|nr:Tat pathway signal protein [Chromatiales bacterium]
LYDARPASDGLASLAVNGRAISPCVKNGYAVINRRWKKGDRISLVLPLEVQRVKAIDQVEATRGRVALRRGPLIYSFESIDQNIDNILPADTPLMARWRPDLLDGVVVIEGAWADGLPLVAIPNYARHNRSAATDRAEGRRRGTRSSVWVRDR